MAEFKDMLKYYRKRENLSQADLAKKLGLGPSTISMYEVGKREPDFETEELIADFFNVDLNTLRGMDVEADPERKCVRIPVYGKVAAGVPIEAVENVIDYEEIPTTWRGKYAALKVKGDSMAPRMQDGDVIIVKLQDDAESGDVVVALINGEEATVKRLIKHQDGITLQPFNSAYDPMYFSTESKENIPVTIWGKVVENRQKF